MRVRARVAVTICVLSAAACTKSSLGPVKPNGLALQLSSETVNADAGTLTVTAQAYEDGVLLLGQPIVFSYVGTDAPAGGTVSTSSTSGEASFSFSGLITAGASTVTVQTGTAPTQISRSAPLTVVAGAPTALTLVAQNQNVPASTANAINLTLSGIDGHGNAIAAPDAFITTDAPSGAVDGLSIR